MADIVLKNQKGEEVTYTGVESVQLPIVGGTTKLYSEGEVIEDVPVTLDFSSGDQTIEAPIGYLVKTAVVQKPSTLIPTNIVKGVDIAGVVGTSEGGGHQTSDYNSYLLTNNCKVLANASCMQATNGAVLLMSKDILATYGFDKVYLAFTLHTLEVGQTYTLADIIM